MRIILLLYQVSPGFQVDAAVTGQGQISDPRLKSVKAELRHCHLDGEIKLQYFDTYTNPYCHLECLTNILLERCYCVPYYFPGIKDPSFNYISH